MLVTSGTESAILSGNASNLQTAINGTNNANLPTKATTTGSTLTPTTCTFTGYLSYITLNVTANGTCGSGGPPISAQVCDATFSGGSCAGGQITPNQENLINSPSYLNNATTQNPGATVNLETDTIILRQSSPSTTTSETITAYWEVFTVGTLTSGTIAVGQQFEDGGSVTSNTCVIWANLSGSGSGSTWLVACADPTTGASSEAISLSDCSLEVVDSTPTPGPSGRAYLEISVNNYCPYWTTSIGSLVEGSSTIATQLMLTSASGSGVNAAYADTPGQIITNAASGMNAVVALDPNFGTFVGTYNPYNATTNTNYQGGPAMPYGVAPALLAWSQAQPGQWPYYYEGWGGAAPAGGNFPWAH